MIDIVIFGSGGHAKVIFSEIAKNKNYNLLGFTDEFKDRGQLVLRHHGKDFFVLGDIKEVLKKKNSKFTI